MASVHKPKTRNSPYWVAAWRDSTGKLYVRSTKQTDRDKALLFALECERAEKHATAGTLTEAQARDIVASIMDRTSTGETFRNPGAREWLTEWVESAEEHKAETTGIRYRHTMKHFLDYLGERADRPIVAITARDIQGFQDYRARQKVGPSTLNVEGKILRAAFTKARKQGLISSNPAEAVDLPKRKSIERGTFTPAEVQLLVNAAEGEWKTLIQIGYYTAARLSECCRVDWKDVDLVRGTITFPFTKGDNEGREMPLHPALAKHFEKIAGDTGGPVMPGLAGVRVSGRRGLSQHFLGIMQKAGIDIETVKGAGKRELHRRSFHSLRHSFTSGLANKGVSPELRMKLTGHKSERVHGGYTHMELKTLKTALKKLPKAKA